MKINKYSTVSPQATYNICRWARKPHYIIESIAWAKIEYVAEKYEGSTSYHGMIVYEQTPVKKDVELYIALTMMWILFSLAGFWFIHCLFLPIMIRCYSIIY